MEKRRGWGRGNGEREAQPTTLYFSANLRNGAEGAFSDANCKYDNRVKETRGGMFAMAEKRAWGWEEASSGILTESLMC